VYLDLFTQQLRRAVDAMCASTIIPQQAQAADTAA